MVEIHFQHQKFKPGSGLVLCIQKTFLTLFELQEHGAVTGIAAEVTAALLIPEQHVLPELKLLCPPQPLHLQRGLIQVQQAANDEGIVIQEARDRRRSGGGDGKNQSNGREEGMRTVFIKYLLKDHAEEQRDELLWVN